MLEYYAGVVSMTKRNVITEGKPNINALNKTEQKQFYKELLNFIITKNKQKSNQREFGIILKKWYTIYRWCIILVIQTFVRVGLKIH